jgi:hypothetical protein
MGSVKDGVGYFLKMGRIDISGGRCQASRCLKLHITNLMGFFSKLFGAPEPKSELLMVPEDASPQETILIGIRSVIEEAGGNCATWEPVAEPGKWVQLMDATINCHYPHNGRPEELFPELCNDTIVAAVEGFEEGQYMTVSLREMNQEEISAWIMRYFSEALSVDLDTSGLSLRMEDL